MRDNEKRKTIRRLWMERPSDQRTEKDLVIFHEFIAENFPALLKGIHRNTLDQLREDIGELRETHCLWER